MSRGGGLRCCLGACGLLLAGTTQAQWSAQVGAASDYVYRGVSLDDGRPAVMAAFNYDGAAGWYLGGQAAQTRLYGESHAQPLWIVDAGYAHALNSRLSWELGATYSIFSGATFWNYAETFVGLSAQDWNLRLYHAPDYFGRNRRSTYLEFNYVHALDERWRLLAHVGMQHAESARGRDRNRTFDASLGVGAKLDRINVQLLRVAVDHANYAYPSVAPEQRQRWVLSVACAF